MDKPLINIITRTSNRPEYFKRNYNSIKDQTYKYIIHHVISDNINDSYVNHYNDIKLWRIQLPLNGVLNVPNPYNSGPLSVHNLYFNQVIPNIRQGWILILDDDDYLLNKFAIENIVMQIENQSDLIIFQMQYENKKVLPPLHLINRIPVLGQIGSPCFLVHNSYARKIKWDQWKCADYRYIKKLWDITGAKKSIERPYIGIGGKNGLGNLGRQNDIIVKDVNLSEHDFIFAISSYNRNDKIKTLISSILSIFKDKSIKIIIYDDCSDTPIKYDNKDVIIIRGNRNNGKQKYYRTINRLLLEALKFKFKWLVQIDDDMLVSSYLPDYLDSRNDDVIKLHQDHRKENWNTYNWIDGGAAYSYNFINKIRQINFISPMRWRIDPKLSSGVWHQLTERINRMRINIEKTNKSFLYHNDENISRMNEFRNTIDHQLITENYFDKVTVIMCVYRRLNRLYKTISQLEKQTYKNFNLIIWNNSNFPDEEILGDVKYDFPIKVTGDNNNNIGGIGRFKAASTLDDNTKVIFIDDDQNFDENMIMTFLSGYEPNTIKSWWAWRFKNGVNYYQREKVTENNEDCHYCGTGGMILNSSVFKNEKIFDIPSKYQFIEDLWLSFFCNHYLNYELKHINNNIEIEEDGKDQYKKLISLKSEFLKYLTTELKWNIQI